MVGIKYKMEKYVKIGTIILLVILIGRYVFFNYLLAVNPNTERIAFITYSHIPRLSALLFRDDIYVMNVDSFGIASVVQQQSIDWGLDWSPQGDKIAYYSYDTKGLHTANADGSGTPELLQTGIFIVFLSWSPDGTKIAFSNGAGSIYIFNLITEQITPLMLKDMKGEQPDWSPDGTKIVFTLNSSVDEPDSSIAIIDMDGTNLIQLTPDDGSRYPKWSPDGNKILFERNRNIYIMNTDGTNVKALLEDGKSYMPDWSPDGQRIVYLSNVNQECSGDFLDAPRFCTNELRVMNTDSSNVKVIRSRFSERYMSPVWAPLN